MTAARAGGPERLRFRRRFTVAGILLGHHILTIHHVRDDVADPVVGPRLLAVGALLVMVGHALRRSGGNHMTAAS